jgi:hypothetical protein
MDSDRTLLREARSSWNSSPEKKQIGKYMRSSGILCHENKQASTG